MVGAGPHGVAVVFLGFVVLVATTGNVAGNSSRVSHESVPKVCRSLGRKSGGHETQWPAVRCTRLPVRRPRECNRWSWAALCKGARSEGSRSEIHGGQAGSRGDVRIERRFASLVRLPLRRLTRYPGSATGWENHALPGTTSFVVELPAGHAPPRRVGIFTRAIRLLVAAR